MIAEEVQKKNQRIALTVLVVVIVMVGLSFASVPLYKIFCQVTGFGGTTQRVESNPEQIIARPITVRFDGNVASDLNWEFKPAQISVDLKIGESKTIHYQAQNLDSIETAGTSVFNVTPLKAGKYFKKVECFCFTEQYLKPQEKVDMPVTFFIDPEMANDRDLNEVNTITLSYSFFPLESDELDKAVEIFYETP